MNGLTYFLARKTKSPWPELVDGPHDTPAGVDRSIAFHARKGDDGPWTVLVAYDPVVEVSLFIEPPTVNELIHPLPEPLS